MKIQEFATDFLDRPSPNLMRVRLLHVLLWCGFSFTDAEKPGRCCDPTCQNCGVRCGSGDWCTHSRANCESGKCHGWGRWCPPPAPAPVPALTVRLGAIRWDNWAGLGHDSTAAATVACMSPLKWHARVPFCGKVLNQTSVDFQCATLAAMQQELDYAVRAGVNFWAFVQYPNQSSLSLAFSNYLAVSPRPVNFSIIMDGNTLPEGAVTSGPAWDAFLERYNHYFTRPDYETVDGQPLVFWFISETKAKEFFGSVAKFKHFAATWSAAAVRPLHFVLMEGYNDMYFKALGMPTRRFLVHSGIAN